MLRFLFLLHRYTGIATCLLCLMWFGSGMVMMYVGFPQLTAQERFTGLPRLDLRTASILPGQALAAAGITGWPRSIHMEMLLDRPAYLIQPWEGERTTVFADDGSVLHRLTPEQALRQAQRFAGVATGHYRGQIERDQWTVPNSLKRFRPLHHVALEDPAGTEVYLSARTGEIVRDTTHWERFWNWCGAVLHWVYFTEIRQDLEIWRQVVLWLSGACIVTSCSGVVVGILRWRPRARYRHGRASPYYGLRRWHHLLGLTAAVPLCTWLISGWISLAPGPWVSEGAVEQAMSERYQALHNPQSAFTLTPALASQVVTLMPAVKEVRLQFWDGKPLYVFATSPERRQLFSGQEPAQEVYIDQANLLTAVPRLFPDARLRSATMLTAYDFYWYAHHTPRPLPVLRVVFDDPQATWLHIDPVTGDILQYLDAAERLYRVLFNALHSLDFPWLLASRPGWDVLLLSLCTLGLSLSITAVILAWRRVRPRLSVLRQWHTRHPASHSH